MTQKEFITITIITETTTEIPETTDKVIINNNGLRVLRWQRPNRDQLRANAQNLYAQNPFATRWDNQLRNF